MIRNFSNSILILKEDKNADLVLHHLSICLKTEGFKVFESSDQKEAFGMCKSQCPAVVIVDLFTPEIEGTYFLKRLRGNSRLKNTSVIMLMDPSMIGYEMGADDYMTRPFSPKQILMRVKQFLNNRSDTFGGELRNGKICSFPNDSVFCA